MPSREATAPTLPGVNVTGHVALAARLDADPAVWLGAALPDLAGAGRHRLLGSTDDPAVATGISLHHRSDDAFHASSWFRSLQDRLRPQLEAVGLTRGAARAVAHVGPELLLDRALLAAGDAGPQRRRAIEEIERRRAALRPLVTRDHDAWDRHLTRVVQADPPDDTTVADVAGRLHRVLARRPRLAFDDVLVAAVEHELDRIVAHVDATADDLLDELAARLA